jgi:hypothetical protein
MKLQLKFDQKAILEFLLQNGEKFVLGVVGVVFLWIVYSAATKARPFDKGPDQLEEQVRLGKQEIDRTPPNTGLVVADFSSLAKQNRTPVAEKPYGSTTPWNAPLFERKPLRDAPPLFAVQQLRGTTGMGAFQVAESGKGGVRGQRWIVLTGLAPLAKQEAEYQEALKHSAGYDPQRDRPVYAGYVVQRVEVANAAEAANPNWEKAKTFVSAQAVGEAKKQWAAVKGAEVATEPLVFPLGPLTRAWDASVAHEPEIPLSKAVGEPAAGGKAAPEKAESGPYKLFRFFDFGVEPGKQYVYRVCLVLQNPNQGVKPNLLKNAKLAESPTLSTNWSEPSAVMSVPRDTRVLAAAVTPASRANSEPTGRIVLVTWLPEQGIEVPKEFPVVRGQIADFSKVPVKVATAERPAAKEKGSPRIFSAGSTTLPIDFLSNATIVDLRGGQRLPGPAGLNAGGEILLLDSDGSLVVRNELDDALTYQRISSAAAEPSAEASAARPGGASAGRGLDKYDDDGSKKRPSRSR